MREALAALAAHGVIGLVRVLSLLPLRVQLGIGRGLGGLLWRLGRSRRRVALRNLALTMPELDEPARTALAREHFALIGRSLVERGLLWFAPQARVKAFVKVRGDVDLGARSGRPVMWLLPHFVGLEWAAPALLLHQSLPAVNLYQEQSNPVFDKRMRAGRARFGPERSKLLNRLDGIRPIMRLMREGWGFVNAPDMDFGPRDSALVPFFGQPACTLLAPARLAHAMDALVQPIVVTLLPGTQGVEVWFAPPIDGYPSGDPEVDAAAFNSWLEARIRERPAQYFWVHKRFKTRPPGEPGVYD